MIVRKLLIFSLIFIPGFILGVISTTFSKFGGEAQRYTKILWKNNYTQISPNKVTDLINQERIKNGLRELNPDKEVCKTADKLAEIYYKKSYEIYYKNNYKEYRNQKNKEKVITDEEVNEIIFKYCFKACEGKRYSVLFYVSLRPEPCSTTNICFGDESFDLLENYPKEVILTMKKTSSNEHNIFLNSQYGCVGSYGGAVVLFQIMNP